MRTLASVRVHDDSKYWTARPRADRAQRALWLEHAVGMVVSPVLKLTRRCDGRMVGAVCESRGGSEYEKPNTQDCGCMLRSIWGHPPGELRAGRCRGTAGGGGAGAR